MRASLLLDSFNNRPSDSSSLRNNFIIPTFNTNYKKFSFTVISSKLLNGFLYKHCINDNHNDKFLMENFVKLFDKYYVVFYDKDPFL